MKAIVCVDKNWGIGKGNELLYHIPADMKYFKEKTIGNVVVMGLATFRSLPGQKPLADRGNIVISAEKDWSAPGVTVCGSLDELFELLERYDTNTVFVIGGASVYEQLLPYCDTAYVTKVDAEKPADKFFPNLDASSDWVLAREKGEGEHNGVNYKFTTYKSI